jgi:hypothetical protein
MQRKGIDNMPGSQDVLKRGGLLFPAIEPGEGYAGAAAVGIVHDQ